MHSLSRRGFLVVGAGGAASAALAACGESVETRDSGHDEELLGAALSAELAVSAAADAAAKAPTEAEAEHELIVAIGEASQARVEELRGLTEAADEGTAPAADGSLAGLVEPLDAAIAAYRPAAGQLSTTELRSTAIGFLTQAAAELAGARTLLGTDPSPSPFVTGESAKPFSDTEGDTTTTTTTESTSTTSTGEDG